MAYFPNGSAFEHFEGENCLGCVHHNDGGCPVALAHFLFAYELCNDKEHPGKVILDMLIPDPEPSVMPRCAMRATKDGVS